MNCKVCFYLKADPSSEYTPFIYGNCAELGLGNPEKGAKMEKNKGKFAFRRSIELKNIDENSWYNFCLVSKDSKVIIEGTNPRKFKNITNNFAIYNEFQKQEPIYILDSIIVNVTVPYRTIFGQNVYIFCDFDSSTNWGYGGLIPLHYIDKEHWGCKLTFPVDSNPRDIHFKYYIYDKNNDSVCWEPCSDHKFTLKASDEPYEIDVVDPFRFEVSELSKLSEKPFTEIFFPREGEDSKTEILSHETENSVLVTLTTKCSLPKKGETMKIIGSKIFGDWDKEKALKMSDKEFPLWKLSIPIPKDQFPIEYKYVICDKSGNIIEEGRENHTIRLKEGTLTESIQSDDWMPTIPAKDEKGFCIKANLDSEGTFTDLYKLIDFCKSTGASMIEVSNIFDKESAFALNTMLIDKSKIEKTKEGSDDLKEIFKTAMINSKQMNEFKKNNEEWLQKWTSFKSSESDQLITWEQFVADQQMREVCNYAKQNRVALRCEIPLMLPIESCDALNESGAFTGLEAVFNGMKQGLATFSWNSDTKKWLEKRFKRCSRFFQSIKIMSLDLSMCFGEQLSLMEEITSHCYSDKFYTKEQLLKAGLWDIDRYVKPYIRSKHFPKIFGEDAEYVQKKYFNARGGGKNKYLTFKFDSIDSVEEKYKDRIEKLLTDVILVEARNKFYLIKETGNSLKELPEPQKTTFIEMMNDKKEKEFTKVNEEDMKMYIMRTIEHSCTNMELVYDYGKSFSIQDVTSNKEQALELLTNNLMHDLDTWCTVNIDDIANLSEKSNQIKDALEDKELIDKIAKIVKETGRVISI